MQEAEWMQKKHDTWIVFTSQQTKIEMTQQKKRGMGKKDGVQVLKLPQALIEQIGTRDIFFGT